MAPQGRTPDDVHTEGSAPLPPRRTSHAGLLFAQLRSRLRWFNQVRTLCVVLAALGAVGTVELGSSGPWMVISQLVAFPLAAGTTDLLVGRYRWRSWRTPWNAVATGLFMALLLPPAGSGLPAPPPILADGVLLSIVVVLGKHLLRYGGRPLLNPAASGVLLGGALLGLAPAWWGTLGPSVGGVALPVFVVGGLVVNARPWRRWPLPTAFFLSFAAVITLQRIAAFSLQSSPLSGGILLSEVLDPATLFFALFMVVEPRTAPADPKAWPFYGGVIGAVAAILAVTVPALGLQSSIGPYGLLLALLLGNLFGLLLRHGTSASTSTGAAAEGRTASGALAPARRRGGGRRKRAPLAPKARWGWPERVLAGTAALVLLGAAYAMTPSAPSTSASDLVQSSLSCAHDNMSIPTTERQTLHHLLGPSVVFWYDNQSGYTVFYDPVNDVTVYETDLFEDHGMAEWNGDDYILATGCHPYTGMPHFGGGG